MKDLAYLTLAATLWAPTTEAAEHVVRMLNAGKDGPMAFEPALIRVAVGDTVNFEPAEKGGHNSVSKVVPEGAQGWKSGFDEAISVKIEKEGAYFYQCEPHAIAGMVGVIIANKPANKDAVISALKDAGSKAAMGKERVQKLAAELAVE
ncbi:MAG: plastocyanin/azurin family copper-binding protein [Gammaproteobacteria bacterium]